MTYSQAQLDEHAQFLASLGFPAAVIDEVINGMRKGLFDRKPSPDLIDRTLEVCRPLLQVKR